MTMTEQNNLLKDMVQWGLDNLDNKSLESFPNNVEELTKLTSLELVGNFENIPNSIGCLANLTELQIISDKIVEIPESISSLINLKKLDINNKYSGTLDNLPKNIGKLTNLTELKVRGV